MIVNYSLYKGIEFVRISELPPLQKNIFTETIKKDLIIKILCNDKILDDCVQFKDYKKWYENTYQLYALAK